MSDLISREYMKSLGATCIASRLKDGTLFPIVAIDELPPADLTREMPSNTLGALDCVSRQAAIDAFWKLEAELRPSAIDAVLDMLKNLPSVQPRKGKWIPVDSYSAYGGDESTWVAHGNPIAFYYCSECKEQAYAGEDGESLITEYCPNCGCRMEEGDSE